MAEGEDPFTQHKVVPDVLDKTPPAVLKVTYGGIGAVKPGMVLTPTQVQKPPKIEFDAKPNTFYSLIMHDPDAPSREDPKFGEWHHWFVANIPGNQLAQGKTMSDYVGSGPPKGTGLHRYVFALCEEGETKQSFQGLTKIGMTSTGRNNQKLRDYLKNYKLTVVASNFYQAEWDDYVPMLYAKLK